MEPQGPPQNSPSRAGRPEGRRVDPRRTDPRRADGVRTTGNRHRVPGSDGPRPEGAPDLAAARARRRQQRELERARRRLVLRRLTQAVGASLVALLLVIGFMRLRVYLLTTPHLALQKIDVKGTQQSKEWEVKALGEVVPGTNILSVDLEETAKRIERHPWISHASLRRVFPDTLEVEVTERAPVAILPMGELYYVDKEGTIFKKVKTGDRLSLPVLSGFDQPGPLQRGKIGRQGIKEALALMNRVSEKTSFNKESISEIHLDTTEGFSLYTANAASEILLGWDNFDVKLDRLGQLLNKQRLDLAQVKRIDLDLSKWAVVTPL